MLIQETFVDRTQNCIYGETEPYEPFTEDTGRLFRSLQQEYGRCSSKMYVDLKDGGSKQVGWVFEKRARYTDCNETYLQETWVTVYQSYEKRTVVEAEYHDFNS